MIPYETLAEALDRFNARRRNQAEMSALDEGADPTQQAQYEAEAFAQQEPASDGEAFHDAADVSAEIVSADAYVETSEEDYELAQPADAEDPGAALAAQATVLDAGEQMAGQGGLDQSPTVVADASELDQGQADEADPQPGAEDDKL